MSNLDDLPNDKLRFYATASYPCSYIPDRVARSQVASPNHEVNASTYSELVRIGFRRSGAFTYRPICDACSACVPVRIDTTKFIPSKSLKRVIKKHTHLSVGISHLKDSTEHYELYQKYQSERHSGGGMDQDSKDQYKHFLLESNVTTRIIEFKEAHKCVAISIVDELDDGISSVYTFFETEDKSKSYGSYSICWQIDLCRSLGLRYLYLGYWIKESEKMSYKTRFTPLEGFIKDRWTIL
jgi:arginine-tRNA-protein transferase